MFLFCQLLTEGCKDSITLLLSGSDSFLQQLKFVLIVLPHQLDTFLRPFKFLYQFLLNTDL